MKKNSITIGTLVVAITIGMTGCNSPAPSDDTGNASESTASISESITNNTDNADIEEDDQTELSLGQTSSNDYLELTLNSVEWTEELETGAESDYGSSYSVKESYSAREGNTLLVIYGTYKNLGTEPYSPFSAAKAEIKINDKYTVGTRVVSAFPDSTCFSNGTIDPLASANIYIYADVSNEMMEALETGTMTIDFKSYTKTGDDSYSIGQDSIGKFKLDFKA